MFELILCDILYPVISNPPLSSGAFHVMLIEVVEIGFATTLVGAAGGPASEEDFVVAVASFDVRLVPTEFIAETLKVYKTPVIKPSFAYVVVEVPVLEVTVDHASVPLFISTLYPDM